jgi:hypothetical protein
VFENRFSRKIIEPNRKEMRRRWRELHKKALTIIYLPP